MLDIYYNISTADHCREQLGSRSGCGSHAFAEAVILEITEPEEFRLSAFPPKNASNEADRTIAWNATTVALH